MKKFDKVNILSNCRDILAKNRLTIFNNFIGVLVFLKLITDLLHQSSNYFYKKITTAERAINYNGRSFRKVCPLDILLRFLWCVLEFFPKLHIYLLKVVAKMVRLPLDHFMADIINESQLMFRPSFRRLSLNECLHVLIRLIVNRLHIL